jgi:GGDEF domain-containing protein
VAVTAFAFELVDAAGAGAAHVREDGTIASASPGFVALAGAADLASMIGAPVSSVLPMLPPLDRLPQQVDASAPVFVQSSPRAGRGRLAVSAAVREHDGQRFLILVDRSRQSGSAEPGPQRTDALLPRPGGVRSRAEINTRIDRALAHARTQGEHVTVMSLQVAEVPDDLDLDGVLLGCVRGMDDVARTSRGKYLILMPDTDAHRSTSLAKRFRSRIQGYGAISVGIAESTPTADTESLVARAEDAGELVRVRGGGVLVAEEVQ